MDSCFVGFYKVVHDECRLNPILVAWCAAGSGSFPTSLFEDVMLSCPYHKLQFVAYRVHWAKQAALENHNLPGDVVDICRAGISQGVLASRL